MVKLSRVARGVSAGVLGAAILVAGPLGASAAPGSSGPGSPVPAVAAGHVSLPIRYAQVAAPIRPDKPGHGPTSSSVVYPPSVIQGAYDFGTYASNGGSGEVIAIVDAYGDPSLSTDLAAFDNKFGISGTGTVATLYTSDGAPTSTNSTWAIETALDVEWAHANAPAATIDLVVAVDSSFQHLLDAVSYAVHDLSPTAVSMSWAAPEVDFSLLSCTDPATGSSESCEAAYEAQFTAKNAPLFFASSGDQGAYDGTHPKTLTVNYPASSPEVIGVGGTTLNVTGTTWSSESAWSGSGGGYSTLFSEPSSQTGAGIPDPSTSRGVPDVSFDANPNTGVYVYEGGTWYAVGGTSVGSPNWAAIAADGAAASHPVSLGGLYTTYGSGGRGTAYSADFHDITSGTNGYYSAGPGWDAVTGIGTPNVDSLL